MKKIVYSVIAVVILAISLTACGGNSAKKTKKSTSSSTSAGSSSIAKKIELEEEKSEYVVNIDDSFEAGIETESARVTLAPEEADFRNLKWGMSKDEIINAEGTGFSEMENGSMYYTRVREEEYPADAQYDFVDEKLAQGTFYITEDKENNSIDVYDYDELVDSLKQRFGEPQMVQDHYYDESVKTDDREQHADLILKNKLNYRTAWLLDDTELRVVMINRGGKLCIGLQYKDAAVTIPAASQTEE